MTYDETEKFLHLVGLNFPNAFRHIQTKEDKELVASQWQMNFKNIEPLLMTQALNNYLMAGIDVATPSLGQLMGDLKKEVKNVLYRSGGDWQLLEQSHKAQIENKQLYLEALELQKQLKDSA